MMTLVWVETSNKIDKSYLSDPWLVQFQKFWPVLYYDVHVFTCVRTVSQAVRMCAWLIITDYLYVFSFTTRTSLTVLLVHP